MENRNEISYEYIRGLTEGEGTFTFSPNKITNTRYPEFAIRMHARDKNLLRIVRDKLNIKVKIYEYNYPGKDGFKRGPTAVLIVRRIGDIKNIIIPLFYKKLIGNKALCFENWVEKMGTDPLVPDIYKFIYKIYKAGFYEKVHKYDF